MTGFVSYTKGTDLGCFYVRLLFFHRLWCYDQRSRHLSEPQHRCALGPDYHWVPVECRAQHRWLPQQEVRYTGATGPRCSCHSPFRDQVGAARAQEGAHEAPDVALKTLMNFVFFFPFFSFSLGQVGSDFVCHSRNQRLHEKPCGHSYERFSQFFFFGRTFCTMDDYDLNSQDVWNLLCLKLSATQCKDPAPTYCVFIKFRSFIRCLFSFLILFFSLSPPGPSSGRSTGLKIPHSHSGYSSSGSATIFFWPLR
jgi:hypothetical protein